MSSEKVILQQLTNKYQVSEYHLMNHLGVKYDNGLYYVGDSEFTNYSAALSAADSAFSEGDHKSIGEESNTNKTSILFTFLKIVLFLFFLVVLFWLLFPLVVKAIVFVIGKIGGVSLAHSGSPMAYLGALITFIASIIVSLIIVMKI